MKSVCATLLATAAVLVTCGRAATTTSGPSASPASLSFSYQVNTTPLPAAAKVTVSLPSSAATSTVIYASICTQAVTTAGNCAASWLSVTPGFGHGPLALNVQVNPSGMAPGSYSATIYIWTSPDVGSNTVPVTLSITNPPSTLVVNPYPANLANFTPASGTTPDTLSFTYTTGAAWAPLQSQLNVATNGGIIPFTATVANAAGSGSASSGVWLRINPVGSTNAPGLTTSGVANSGSAVGFYVSLDQSSVQALLPGSYGGTVTFAANTAANGSHIVAVNLVISAGAPVIASLFPTSVVMAPSVDPVITINGANFFSTSVASVAADGGPDPTGLQCTQTGTPTAMTSQQLLSQTVVQASIPKGNALLAAQNQLCICVTNPAPPSNPGQAPACAPLVPDYTFHVISSSTMAVTSVVNAASYLQTAKQVTAPDPVSAGQTSVSPGEIVSIFGQNLGPSTPVPAIPGPSPAQISSSAALPASIVTSSLTSLVFQINGAAPANTVTVDFTLDPFYTTNPVGTTEPLANIVAYINQLTKTAGFGSSVASLTSGGAYITLTSPTVGAASTLVVLDGGGATAASRVFQFTTNANVSSSGSNTATFPYSLSNMQVLFTYGATTTPAPIIMVSSNQINAMVPFEIVAAITNPPAAPGTATMKVLSNSGSATFSSPIVVVNENPGIFTLGGLGTGQGAVLNCDSSSAWTVNGAKNTAPRGTAICIYATGLGVLTTPLAADNLPAGLATDKVSDPVQVTIGGQPAVVTYAGTSYGSIGGLTQINAIVPPTVTAGQAVSLVVTGGTATTARASQAGVTVAVK